jgi:quinol monooxygenase YgiN
VAVTRHGLAWGLVLGLAMSALAVTPAVAATDATVYTATYVEVAPPSTAQAATVLRQYGQASRKEPGHVRVEILQRLDRPNQFVILMAWKDQPALEAHRAATAMKDARDKLQPLLTSPNDERVHLGLSLGPGAAASAGGPLYVVTHVDVIPPRKDDGVAALTQLAEHSRRDAGNVRFDVVQQTNRPNHFTVVEAWTDRKAFDAHGMAAHARRFREQLAPMSGSLYDERLYTELK